MQFSGMLFFSSRRRHTRYWRDWSSHVCSSDLLEGCREIEGDHLGFYSEFPTTQGEQVLLKTGISFVSVEDARGNLKHDLPGWDFGRARKAARASWEKAFARVGVAGGPAAQREVFATCLYHLMLEPRDFTDVSGLHFGADGKAHRADGFTYRTIFSGWDVFRSLCPLLTLIRPDVVNDTVNYLTEQAELSGNGHLGRWEIVAVESGCMIGDPAVSVSAEAYRAGIRGYDPQRIYELCQIGRANV